MESKLPIEGFAELQKRLAELPKKLRNGAIRKGTRAGAKILRARLKEATPKRTGAAAKAIKVRSLKRSRRFVGTTVRYERPPGAKILYIMVINYGRKKRLIKGSRFIQQIAKGGAGQEAVDVAVRIIVDEINANRP